MGLPGNVGEEWMQAAMFLAIKIFLCQAMLR
jgi:hypothetical protein